MNGSLFKRRLLSLILGTAVSNFGYQLFSPIWRTTLCIMASVPALFNCHEVWDKVAPCHLIAIAAPHRAASYFCSDTSTSGHLFVSSSQAPLRRKFAIPVTWICDLMLWPFVAVLSLERSEALFVATRGSVFSLKTANAISFVTKFERPRVPTEEPEN